MSPPISEQEQGARFTPGPWEIEGLSPMCGIEITADGRDGEGWIIASLGEPVDYVGLPKEDLSAAINAEIEANAHLIAASPTMYDYIARKAAEGDEEAKRVVETIHARS